MLPAGAAKKETAKATFPSIAMTITKAIGGGGQVHTRVSAIIAFLHSIHRGHSEQNSPHHYIWDDLLQANKYHKMGNELFQEKFPK